MDVVDQPDRASADRGAIDHPERAAHRARALRRVHPAQHRGTPGTDQRQRVAADRDDATERVRDQRRLIEPPRPEPPAVKRYRHEQIDRVDRREPRDLPRHRHRDPRSAGIFEPQREPPCDRTISDRGADAGMTRRARQAGGAARLVAAIHGEREVAPRAPGRRDEDEAVPARRAEAMIGLDRIAAAGAARRQRQRGGMRQPREGARDEIGHPPLVARRGGGHKRGVSEADDIFDRVARRRRRDRAAPGFAGHDFLRAAMLDGIYERLEAVTRDFGEVLDLGCFDGALRWRESRIARVDAGFDFAAGAGGIQADEDRLPFADHSFDCVISAGVLDQVNDLPGALTLARRALRPDGLFLGAFVGGRSLPALRGAVRAAEGERPAARLHPLVDVRSAGDLLVRAGFALPVADVETLDISYRSLGGLIDDLRGMAASNILRSRTPMTRATLSTVAGEFAAAADEEGRTHEQIELVFLTGWAPDASQPKPAKRGSATASLAAALPPREG